MPGKMARITAGGAGEQADGSQDEGVPGACPGGLGQRAGPMGGRQAPSSEGERSGRRRLRRPSQMSEQLLRTRACGACLWESWSPPGLWLLSQRSGAPGPGALSAQSGPVPFSFTAEGFDFVGM